MSSPIEIAEALLLTFIGVWIMDLRKSNMIW
jgi:hypothetical protein